MRNRLLIVDNYDSFTYNLVQLIEQSGVSDYVIKKNDQITLKEAGKFDAFLFSPGPGIPSEAGIMCDLIKHYALSKKMLGICLGHQAIAECFGAKLEQMQHVMHGIASETILINKEADKIFLNMPNRFTSGRYHSWVVSRENFPDELAITAIDNQDKIMAIRHKQFDIHGLQFHPESHITQGGLIMIKNWLV
ncbi:MAG: aminodeoxychorismate/anthranilate synthase component II [Bacteroidota bacterium]